MNENDRQSNSDAGSDSSAVEKRPRGVGRRTLLKGMAASAPVLMTLHSRPAWSIDGNCTISAMTSANLSRPERTEACEGCAATFWKDNPGRWPEGFDPGTPVGDGSSGCFRNDGSRFHDYFVRASGYDFDDLTLMQVMRIDECSSTANAYDDPYQLAFHAVAALLNAAHAQIQYGYAWADIQRLYDERVQTDPEGLKNDLVMLNQRYCPLPPDSGTG